MLAAHEFFRLNIKNIRPRFGRRVLSDVRAYQSRTRERDLKHRTPLNAALDYVKRELDFTAARAEVGYHTVFLNGYPGSAEELFSEIDAAARGKNGEYKRHGGHQPRLGSFITGSFTRGISLGEASAALERFIRFLGEEFGVAAEAVIHLKRGKPDHFHAVVTDRIVSAAGVGAKQRRFNAISQKAEGKGVAVDDKLLCEATILMRDMWAAIMSEVTGREILAGSFASRGLGYEPVKYWPQREVMDQQRAGREDWRIERQDEILAREQMLEALAKLRDFEQRSRKGRRGRASFHATIAVKTSLIALPPGARSIRNPAQLEAHSPSVLPLTVDGRPTRPIVPVTAMSPTAGALPSISTGDIRRLQGTDNLPGKQAFERPARVVAKLTIDAPLEDRRGELSHFRIEQRPDFKLLEEGSPSLMISPALGASGHVIPIADVGDVVYPTSRKQTSRSRKRRRYRLADQAANGVQARSPGHRPGLFDLKHLAGRVDETIIYSPPSQFDLKEIRPSSLAVQSSLTQSAKLDAVATALIPPDRSLSETELHDASYRQRLNERRKRKRRRAVALVALSRIAAEAGNAALADVEPAQIRLNASLPDIELKIREAGPFVVKRSSVPQTIPHATFEMSAALVEGDRKSKKHRRRRLALGAASMDRSVNEGKHMSLAQPTPVARVDYVDELISYPPRMSPGAENSVAAEPFGSTYSNRTVLAGTERSKPTLFDVKSAEPGVLTGKPSVEARKIVSGPTAAILAARYCIAIMRRGPLTEEAKDLLAGAVGLSRPAFEEEIRLLAFGASSANFEEWARASSTFELARTMGYATLVEAISSHRSGTHVVRSNGKVAEGSRINSAHMDEEGKPHDKER